MRILFCVILILLIILLNIFWIKNFIKNKAYFIEYNVSRITLMVMQNIVCLIGLLAFILG